MGRETGGATRRQLMSGMLGAAAAAALVRPAPAQEAAPPAPAPAAKAPPAPAAAPPGTLTTADVAAAEKLAGVRYTEAERTQLLTGYDDQLDRLRALRAFHKPNELAPATVFDPRLPGRVYPAQDNTVRLAGEAPPMPDAEADLAFAAAAHLSAWMAAGRLTSERLTRLYLDRIARLGPALACFVTVTAERALREARQADAERRAGRARGPLHGLPYVLKDLADTAGIPTTWGAGPYRDRVPERDAVVVERLRQAGAVLLGKTTLGEIAYGDIWYAGITRNPWNRAEGSSGSSAGSAAAVAAGLAAFGIGTETLGSIVSPSHRCGAAGLRPTFGRVARTGCMALCWSLDKVGPIARTVEDTALVLAAVNGADAGDPSSLDHGFSYDGREDPRRLRLGYDPAWFEGEDATEVDRAALEAARRLGFTLHEVRLPDLPVGTLATILEAEASAAFEDLTLSDRDQQLRWQADEAWPNTWRRARFLPAVDLINAERVRRRVMEAMDALFGQADVLIGPNFAGRLLLATNATGHPQLTLRAGFREQASRPTAFGPLDKSVASARVPHNISLWAPLFEERRLLAVGHALEQALGAWRERPEMAA
ncbi:MAG TPA: amidase [Azospirillaceae bacterium]|nr:amidase [Azospirillaceae bacterium]